MRYIIPSSRRIRATRRAIFFAKLLQVLGTIGLGLLMASPMIYDALCHHWGC